MSLYKKYIMCDNLYTLTTFTIFFLFDFIDQLIFFLNRLNFVKGCIDSNHESYIFHETSYFNKIMTDILRKLTFFQLTLSLNQSLTFFLIRNL